MGRGSKPGEHRGGRKPGVPNKATAQAREAIGLFVDSNAHRLQGWLDAIAEGVWGEPDKDGNRECLVTPDPKRAFELFQSVIEYHVPKLTRSEQKHDHTHRGSLTIKR